LISTRHIERIRGSFCNVALYKLTFTFTVVAYYLLAYLHLTCTKNCRLVYYTEANSKLAKKNKLKINGET